MKDIFSIDNRGVNSEEENIFEELETNYHANFKKVILENSVKNNDYSKAIKEWIFYGDVFEELSYCICGHSIRENYVIYNIHNHRTLIVGNHCIKKVHMIRKPANKSRKNYLEMAKIKAKNIGESDFIKRLFETFETTEKIEFNSKKELQALERIGGLPWRYKINKSFGILKSDQHNSVSLIE